MTNELRSLREFLCRVLTCSHCGMAIPLGTSPLNHVCTTGGKTRPKP